MGSRSVHEQAIAMSLAPRGAAIGAIAGMQIVHNPAAAYHYGRWSGGNPDAYRVRGNVAITDASRVRRDGNALRIAVPMQSGEPCEVRVVNSGGFSMFYVCCGGHCAPMPIVFQPQPGSNARPPRPSSYATVGPQGANCWTGIGHNNIVMLCCDVGDDTHCIPMPITFGPLPQSNAHEITHQALRHGNPRRGTWRDALIANGGPQKNCFYLVVDDLRLYRCCSGKCTEIFLDGSEGPTTWNVPTGAIDVTAEARTIAIGPQARVGVRYGNPQAHAVGDEWWEYSADLDKPSGDTTLWADLTAAAPGYALPHVGDIKYRMYFGGVIGMLRVHVSGQHNGAWYNCVFTYTNGAGWSLTSCTPQPSVPGGAVQYQHPGFGYTLGQPIVDWSRRAPRLRARTYRNPMFAATTPSGPTEAPDCSNPNTPASECTWFCMPMPRPGDLGDEHCVRVPRAAQLRGAYFTTAPGIRPTIRERIAARYRGW